MRSLKAFLDSYDYFLPKDLIAQTPASPRDQARLLVYNRKTAEKQEDAVLNLAKYLPPRSVLVFNQTKVIPARLTLYKSTGGKVEVLIFGGLTSKDEFLSVWADRALKLGTKLSIFPLHSSLSSYSNLPRSARPNTLEKCSVPIFKVHTHFKVVKQQGQNFFLKPSFPLKGLPNILERYGQMPLPPYLRRSPLKETERRKNYQTIFAKNLGSIAAPTASLHFTKRLIKKLKAAGHDIAFVTLHVGLGTFAPLTAYNIQRGSLHQEYYEIDKKTATFLNKAKQEGRPIVAVGTTVARTLEGACQLMSLRGVSRSETTKQSRRLKNLRGQTDLFIQPGYQFKFVDHLITNFHVPRSSLMMLVAALTGREKLLALYKHAMKNKFRFFSFGDGMLIL